MSAPLISGVINLLFCLEHKGKCKGKWTVSVSAQRRSHHPVHTPCCLWPLGPFTSASPPPLARCGIGVLQNVLHVIVLDRFRPRAWILAFPCVPQTVRFLLAPVSTTIFLFYPQGVEQVARFHGG